MIRTLRNSDQDSVADIWLSVNIQAHSFVPVQYWQEHFEAVKEQISNAEVYVFENEDKKIQGFIGLQKDYIAGIFVCTEAQSNGIGKMLLDFVKHRKNRLCLHVYQKNQRAVKFYQREDFIIQGETADESTGEKEYSMRWDSRIPDFPG